MKSEIIKSKTKFTYEWYNDFIIEAKEYGEIVSFLDYSSGDHSNSNSIILRHDVDFSIDSAYKMYQLEKDIGGITSTYFFLIGDHYYNVLTKENKKKIKEMSDNGFEVGLHFDPTNYEIGKDALLTKALFEASILENVIDMKINSISMHQPMTVDNSFFLSYFNDAYDKKWFNNDIYLSDSCMDFRGKNPFDFITKDYKVKQILFHPFHFNEIEKQYYNLFADKITTDLQVWHKDLLDNRKYLKETKLNNTNILEYLIKNGE